MKHTIRDVLVAGLIEMGFVQIAARSKRWSSFVNPAGGAVYHVGARTGLRFSAGTALTGSIDVPSARRQQIGQYGCARLARLNPTACAVFPKF